MKIDQEYMKRILQTFENSSETTLSRLAFKNLGFNHDEYPVVLDRINELVGNGFLVEAPVQPLDPRGQYDLEVMPLQITEPGRTFLYHLDNNTIWQGCFYFMNPAQCPHYSDDEMRECISAMSPEEISATGEYKILDEKECEEANELFCRKCDTFEPGGKGE